MRRRGSRDTQYTVQYSKCHSSRSTTSARPWGNHAYSAGASGDGPFYRHTTAPTTGSASGWPRSWGKGAGLALLAVPMVEAFTFTQAQFQRILSNFLGLEGAICVPHTHHCGGGVTRALPHARDDKLSASMPSDALSHLVVQNGVTDAAVVKPDSQLQTEVPPPGRGSSWK